MAWVITTSKPDTGFGASGSINVCRPDDDGFGVDSFFALDLPDGVNPVAQKPSAIGINNDAVSRLYLVGSWTDNLVITENYTLARQGVIPPPNPLINGTGAGFTIGVVAGAGTGVTGDVIAYVSYLDAINNRKSALSAASPEFTVTNKNFVWSNLGALDGHGDPTITHIQLWRAMDGESPRLVMTVDIGTTTVTENVATLSLGEAFGDNFIRFPRSRYNTYYHNRQVLSGDDQYPDRIYFSPIDDPENYGGFFLRSRNGEKVIGLFTQRDALVVLCAESSYVIQGYTEDDIQMDVLEPAIGGISHHAVVDLHGIKLVPSQIGWYLCTGTSMHPVSTDFQFFWRHHFTNNVSTYRNSWAVNDVESNTYKLYVGLPNVSINEGSQGLNPLWTEEIPTNNYWVADYTDMIAETGGQFSSPRLGIDSRARVDGGAARLRVPGGVLGHLFTGSDDGKIRRENITDGTIGGSNDDGDDFQKTFYVLTGHYFFDQPGGNTTDAATFKRFWNFIESEANQHEVQLFCGDERASDEAFSHAGQGGSPPGIVDPPTMTFPAGAQRGDDGGGGLYANAAQCVYFWEPNLQGRGIAVGVKIVAPAFDLDVDQLGSRRMPAWKGFGVTRLGAGSTYRAPVTGSQE